MQPGWAGTGTTLGAGSGVRDGCSGAGVARGALGASDVGASVINKH